MMREPDAVVFFHLPFDLKDRLVSEARERKLSVTKLINRLIVEALQKKPIATGRGHTDNETLQKVKEFMRMRYPEPVRAVDLAQYTGKSQARAARLLDYFSGDCGENENTNTDFLVYCNDDEKPVTYSIFIDKERGIYAY
jgi:hypothetical protein